MKRTHQSPSLETTETLAPEVVHLPFNIIRRPGNARNELEVIGWVNLRIPNLVWQIQEAETQYGLIKTMLITHGVASSIMMKLILVRRHFQDFTLAFDERVNNRDDLSYTELIQLDASHILPAILQLQEIITILREERIDIALGIQGLSKLPFSNSIILLLGKIKRVHSVISVGNLVEGVDVSPNYKKPRSVHTKINWNVVNLVGSVLGTCNQTQ